MKLFLQVIMVRGHRGSRRRGAGGRGVTPPIVPMPEGSNPQGDEKILSQNRLLWEMW
jgi:hypothetical protein